MTNVVDPVIEDETPFYVKLRAEADKELRTAGSGLPLRIDQTGRANRQVSTRRERRTS